MRVLVTGAAGFSGSQIAARLARSGLDVVAGYRHAALPAWLAQMPRIEPRRVDWLEGDTGLRIDGIVHAAATSPAPGISDDVRGLSVLLSWLKVLNDNHVRTVGDLLFVGNTGEEELGNLRGMKRVLADHPAIADHLATRRGRSNFQSDRT